MLMAALALLSDNPNPTRKEVSEGLGGNLCRCTGYSGVIDSILSAVEHKNGS
jgi:carbon-monoxide dehydrogenase small subunit